mgnify:CR=1 FL=1
MPDLPTSSVWCGTSLNESPHPKVGKYAYTATTACKFLGLNESPHPKVGKLEGGEFVPFLQLASMKVPTRRWGNIV